MSDAILEVEHVFVTFGGVHALEDFTLSVPLGGRVAVIGPNGAGKSTLIKSIAGDITPNSGDVRFEGRSVRRLSTPRRARLGIGRTFQNLELFLSMSVLDNVLAALDAETSLLGSLRSIGHGAQRRQRALDALAVMGIDRYANMQAGALSYGIRKLVDLAQVLVTEPRLLLLDEPVAGLHDSGEFVHSLVAAINQRECAVVLIEHDMETVQTICDSVYVLDSGQTIAQGSFAEIAADPRVIEAYLGVPDDA